MTRDSLVVRAIIPIRSGSKSIPDKNIKPFCGRPLFYWATRAALDSGIFNGGVYLASDSEAYLAEVAKWTPEAHALARPAETAQDTSTSESVMVWFLDNHPCDVISLVQVTTPTVTPGDFVTAFRRFLDTEADSLLTGVPFTRFVWKENGIPLNYDPIRRPRRQDMEAQILENGSFYFTKSHTLKTYGSRLGGKIAIHTMDERSAVEIDEPRDWETAESAFAKTLSRPDGDDLKVVVVDVDGTLTDGGMYYSARGEELKKFNTRDGAALAQLRDLGFVNLVCTGEASPSVDQRVKKLGIEHYIRGVKDKPTEISRWLRDNGYDWNNVVYVGDELNDLDGIRLSAYSFCPADAHPDVRRIASVITSAKGGEGVLREVVADLVDRTRQTESSGTESGAGGDCGGVM